MESGTIMMNWDNMLIGTAYGRPPETMWPTEANIGQLKQIMANQDKFVTDWNNLWSSRTIIADQSSLQPTRTDNGQPR